MGCEPGHCVELQEPGSGLVDDEIDAGNVSAAEATERLERHMGALAGDAGPKRRVDDIACVSAVVLGLVVIERGGGDDLDEGQRPGAQDADGDGFTNLEHDSN